jgi:hypothetical protein
MRSDVEYTIVAYDRYQHVVIETWHTTAGSRDVEIAAFEERIERGEISHIVVTNHVSPFGCYRIP